MAIRVTNVTAQMLFDSPDIFRTVSDTLAFIDEPFARKIRVSNYTVQILQASNGIFRTLSDNIFFQEQLFNLLLIEDRQVPSDTINFSEEVIAINLGDLQAFDTLDFTEVVRVSPINRSFIEQLSIIDGVAFCFGAPHTPIVVTDTIVFLEVASTIAPVLVSDTISFSQVVTNTIHNLSHFLDFVETVSAGKGFNLVQVIPFSDELASESEFLRSVADANFIEHSLTYYIDNDCNRKQYARFIGEGSAPIIPTQRLTFNATLVLEAVDSSEIITLRNPETDDTDRLGFSRINRETRGGELNVFADPIWAEVNTLLFTITALADGSRENCPDVINSLLTFFQDTLGEEIFLHDWTGTSWQGVVTTPNETAVEDDAGWWTIAFEFEGIAKVGSVPNNNLVISEALTQNWDRLRTLSDPISFTETIKVQGIINEALTDTLSLAENISGEVMTTIMEHDLSAGSAVDLEGTSPDIGISFWRAHENYQEDGTMTGPISAGAYYPFSPQDGTVYELTFEGAHVVTYTDAENCIWGFFENVSLSDTSHGPPSDGTIDPTTTKAAHLMREVNGGTRNNSIRRGSESDGVFDTLQWTDVTLRTHSDTTLDLRITLDTRSSNWMTLWEAKLEASGSYTEVGPTTNLQSENIGSVGFSNDSVNTELTLDKIVLLERKPV